MCINRKSRDILYIMESLESQGRYGLYYVWILLHHARIHIMFLSLLACHLVSPTCIFVTKSLRTKIDEWVEMDVDEVR